MGVSSRTRHGREPVVRELTFDVRPGQVTALVGPEGAGKSSTLRLLLGLDEGRGDTHFRGSPLHRLAHPAREVGALLGDVPGHPARTVRSQLRMVGAAVGAPPSRVDGTLAATGLTAHAGRRLDRLSLGMDRRLGIGCALLAEPGTLLLDEPLRGLPPEERSWWYALLRAHAERGGTVLCTTADPREAARFADRVLAIDAGRLVADQDAAAFARSRLRPRVAVRSPHAVRLAGLLQREARAGGRGIEAVTESGGLLSVYGSTCAEVGETAFRHRVLLHRLTDESGDTAPDPSPVPPGDPAPDAPAGTPPEAPRAPRVRPARGGGPLVSAPVRPLRYEVLRMTGVRTAPLVMAGAVVASVILCVLLARSRAASVPLALAGWPALLPLPPAALAAGLVGALSLGEEHRYPALAALHGPLARRLRLLAAKLLVTAVAALLTALLAVGIGAAALALVYGPGSLALPGDAPALLAGWCALAVGCAWAGLLGAGVFRVTAAGVAAVLAVPVAVVPLVREAVDDPGGGPARSAAGLPGRLGELSWTAFPGWADGWPAAGTRLFAQPMGVALVLSLSVLICAYMVTAGRREVLRRP
ncbi:ATP-binding cassette domain-containing protein [Streptomyces yaizuensis]|uniref:ATP-binding cassette domain-containing protein n=2 Tax=Streptomyces yaizuensis TaxID=2989713 RepID=A0ABQ5PAT0_9ACTN|nr:ATP-binding cassette domain-containing protein [Streptomyces sp. YSPA8]